MKKKWLLSLLGGLFVGVLTLGLAGCDALPSSSKGDPGADGKSAYQIWLDNGYSGSEVDFLDWLKGEDGQDGINGEDGDDGKSAYQVWLEAGNQGDEADFLAWLKGQDGVDGDDGEDGRGILKTEIIDGYLWITYTDAPENPVNVGKLYDVCEHNWSAWVTYHDSTCEVEGLRARKCPTCGTTEMDMIAPLGHVFTDYVSDNNATCTQDGTKTANCDHGCGETDTVIDEGSALGHTYTVYVGVYQEATCTTNRIDTYKCVRCDDEEHREILGTKTEHDYTAEVVAPTCTERGYTTHTCDCGDAYVDTYVSALGHDYKITTTHEATCTQDGYILFTCQREDCGATKTQILYAQGHIFGDDNVCDECGYTVNTHVHDYEEEVIVPTCTTMGYTLYTCDCGYTYKGNLIDQLGHAFGTGVVTTEKTCTTDGVMTYTCTRGDCTASYTRIIPAGHDWSETVTTEKTCTTDGSVSKTCKDCGATVTEIIPASHDWDDGVVTKEPACKEKGEKTCTCQDCGATDVFEVDELGHCFVDGVCIRCGAKIEDIVTPDDDFLEYGMYFDIDDILSNYGPDYINRYGVLLDYNESATIKKVGVYLTQDGTMWRRCIACTGDNITYATYVPFLSKDDNILYTGLNSDWINIFRLSENSDGIWCYSNYATIGVNLEDAQGNLLLSLYDIGRAGTQTRVFSDLDEMIEWLKDPSDCIYHDYEEERTQELTCTQDGIVTFTCKNCDSHYQVVEKAQGHDYEETARKAADCEEDGYIEYTCGTCGDVYRDVIEGGHEYESTVTQPTCTAQGYTTHTCGKCSDEYVDTYVNALNHSFTVYVGVYQAATCEGDRIDTYRCVRCTATENRVVANSALGHVFTDYVSDNNATCTQDGTKTANCDHGCGETDTVIDDDSALGHTYTVYVGERTPATCEGNRVDVYQCVRCTATEDRVVENSALGHSFTDYVSDNNATCTQDGTKTANCDHGCGETDTVIDEGSALGHNWDGNACTRCPATKDPDPDDRVYTRIDENGNEDVTGEYILFGNYPQSEVTEAALTTTLTAKTGALPTSTSAGLWTDYGYYSSGAKASYMWYIDVEEDGERYRGVYFDKYRSYYTSNAASTSTDYTYQAQNEYLINNVYWFAYEPIKWRILDPTNTDGTALLLCEMIIDSQAYQNEYTYNSSDGKYYTSSNNAPSGTYANNYEYSTIRSWLNDTFYDTAFSSLQQAIIQTEEVKNDASTTNSSSNSYACSDTYDKVWLMSYQEMLETDYGFSSSNSTYDEARRKQTTSYAQCQGAYTVTDASSDYYGNGYWWLRSPYSGFSYNAFGVYYYGYVNDYSFVYGTLGGVSPALKIEL